MIWDEDYGMKIAVAVIHIRTRARTHTLTHSHKPVHLDFDECARSNGGCHSKRTCINTLGSMKCDDCGAGYANDGAKGCKGVCALIAHARSNAPPHRVGFKI